MRARTGNPYNEVHGKNLRAYEFVADGTKTPAEILAAAETATGLRLQGDPLGQHGYINTSIRPDGSCFVAIVLYEACAGCGQHSIPLMRAVGLDVVKQAALKIAVGESAQHRLTGNAVADTAILRRLGFKDEDAALRGSSTKREAAQRRKENN